MVAGDAAVRISAGSRRGSAEQQRDDGEDPEDRYIAAYE
jgi:hypothetical protein